MNDIVLAIDPGRSKCGVAIVKRAEPGGLPEILCKCVLDTQSAFSEVCRLAAEYAPGTIIVGDGTSSASAVKSLKALGVGPVNVVDEKFTTVQARARYFLENPPKGIRRLIPISMQTPPCPYDDYVAVILAERYLEES